MTLGGEGVNVTLGGGDQYDATPQCHTAPHRVTLTLSQV